LGISAELHFSDFVAVEQYFRAGGFLLELNPLDWNDGDNFPVLHYLKLIGIVFHS